MTVFLWLAANVDTARGLLGTELAALVGESYDRAYGDMVRVQQLTELEEVIAYSKADTICEHWDWPFLIICIYLWDLGLSTLILAKSHCTMLSKHDLKEICVRRLLYSEDLMPQA